MKPVAPHQARFYEKAPWDTVICKLCPHECVIAPSRTGVCGVRTNRDGELTVDNYGRVTSEDFLSSEDLPLYHFKPSMTWVQYSGRGCTMRCPFCNTYNYSQVGGVRSFAMTPGQLVATAIEKRCGGIAFGVNEPATMHEFICDVFMEARDAGLQTHVATGGMWSPDALREIAPMLSAATFGLKGLKSSFLQTILGADLDAILGNIDLLMTMGVHVEFSWLVIPGETDDPAQAEPLARIVGQFDQVPPIILLPYQPAFTWNREGAELRHLQAFRAALKNVYPGTIYEAHPESLAQNTCCPKCARPLVRRGLAGLIVTSHDGGRAKENCPGCGTPVPYVA